MESSSKTSNNACMLLRLHFFLSRMSWSHGSHSLFLVIVSSTRYKSFASGCWTLFRLSDESYSLISRCHQLLQWLCSSIPPTPTPIPSDLTASKAPYSSFQWPSLKDVATPHSDRKSHTDSSKKMEPQCTMLLPVHAFQLPNEMIKFYLPLFY